jgi:dienelactone hydrolase
MILARALALVLVVSAVGPAAVARADAGPGGSEFVEVPGIGLDPGQRLVGVLFRPEGKGPFPAVVAAHGCSGLLDIHNKMYKRDLDWGLELRRQGILTLFIDSFRSRNISGGCASGDPPAKPWAERTRDSYAGLLYLQGRADVKADRIGLMGWSHGGATVMFTVATQDAARPAALPKGDFRAAVAFYPGWCRADRISSGWAPAMPLLVLLGDADVWTRAKPCAEITEAARQRGEPVETIIYPGAYHDFDSTEPLHTLSVMNGKSSISAKLGRDPAARAAAYARVTAYFGQYLKGTGP